MKILLILSLICNVILGIKLFQKRPLVKPPLERIVIQDHPAGVAPVPPKAKEPSTEAPEVPDVDRAMIDERLKSLEDDKKDFLFHELEMTPDELKLVRKIQDRYSKKITKLIPLNPTSDLPIEKRRQILDLEEARDQEIQKIFGKTRWEKFQKYKEKYNRRQFKKSQAEGDFVIPMEI